MVFALIKNFVANIEKRRLILSFFIYWCRIFFVTYHAYDSKCYIQKINKGLVQVQSYLHMYYMYLEAGNRAI